MASTRSLDKWSGHRHLQNLAESTPKKTQEQSNHVFLSNPTSRRCAILISTLPFTLTSLPQLSEARERRNKKTIPLEDYLTSR
jgi:peptidylprolyl isomerase